jgi:hypothetical protein
LQYIAYAYSGYNNCTLCKRQIAHFPTKPNVSKEYAGRECRGVSRGNFIISPDGRLAGEYRGVDPKQRAAQIIADLRQLQAAGS